MPKEKFATLKALFLKAKSYPKAFDIWMLFSLSIEWFPLATFPTPCRDDFGDFEVE
jgi:hypothetical protein